MQARTRQFRREMDRNRRKVAFATKDALNDAGADAIEAVQDHMKRVFDRPTRWTLNAFWLRRASTQRQVARIERKSFAGRRFYLEVQASGGGRPQTGLERLMSSRLAYAGNIVAVTPAAGARRNRYGNMSPGQIQRILSAVQAQGDARQNTTAASKARGKRTEQYFVPRPGSRLSPGVWRRRGNKLTKVLHFTERAPQYRKRFHFERVAHNAAAATFRAHFAKRYRAELARAK